MPEQNIVEAVNSNNVLRLDHDQNTDHEGLHLRLSSFDSMNPREGERCRDESDSTTERPITPVAARLEPRFKEEITVGFRRNTPSLTSPSHEIDIGENFESNGAYDNPPKQMSTSPLPSKDQQDQPQLIVEEEKHILWQLLLYMRNRNWKKKLMTLLVILSLALVICDFLTTHYIHNALQAFLKWLENNTVAGFFIFLGLFVVAAIAFVPPYFLTFGCGFVFAEAYGVGVGIVVATWVSFVGLSLGALLAFFRARYMMRDLVKLFARRYSKVKAIDLALKRRGFRVMFLLRLCPLIPFNALNYIGGITGVKWYEFAASLIGFLPATTLTVTIGATAGGIADEDKSHEQKVASVVSIVIGSVFGILALALTWRLAREELDKETNMNFEVDESASASASSTVSGGSLSPTGSLPPAVKDVDLDNLHDEEWFWVWA